MTKRHVKKIMRGGKSGGFLYKYSQLAVICSAFVFLFFLCANRIHTGGDNEAATASLYLLDYDDENALNKYAPRGGDESPDYVESLQMTEGVIGREDVDWGSETDESLHIEPPADVTFSGISDLRDLSYLQKHVYTVDSRTAMTVKDFNADELLSVNLQIDTTLPGPKILIFHTHSASELFADSVGTDSMEGIMGAGEELTRILQEEYGIETMHHTGIYDVIGSRVDRNGSYERVTPAVKEILEKYPSIQVAIDLHRDGVTNDKKFVTAIDGKPTAQIMFFNGLCKVYEDGSLQDYVLKNPYLDTNLAFSLNSQLTANALYPGFTRKIYLNAYRYSLYMLPKSLLIECGANTNTKEEIWNAMQPLAKVLATVIL
ncbi:MAG: stage II sporulation protein P [Clostridiales bacterium]|nr:stage II sporulation protein P [Clostridiales bacterium]